MPDTVARPAARRPVRIGPGCQAVRLKTGWWHLRWYDPERTPKQKQHALDTDDEAVALTRAREKYERKLAGLYDPWKGAGRALTVEQACEAYAKDQADQQRSASIRLSQHTARLLARSTGRGWVLRKTDSGADPAKVMLRDITSAHVRRFVYRDTLSRVSHRTYWARVRAFFEWAKKAGHVDVNPVDEVPRPASSAAKMKHLSADQIARLLAAIEFYHSPQGPLPEHVRKRASYPLWSRDAFELYATSGLRCSEGVRLRWKDIVWPEQSAWGVGYIHVVDEGRVDGRRTKTGRSRQVTMIPQAERLLRRLYDETRRTDDPDEHVLKAGDGLRGTSAFTISQNFRHFVGYAKLPPVPLHGLRHSFAVELLLRGASLIQVRDEMGHSSVQTTEGYLTLLPAERARSTAALFAEPTPLQPATSFQQDSKEGENEHEPARKAESRTGRRIARNRT